MYGTDRERISQFFAMERTDLHLASASARRRDILTALGLTYSWAAEDVDEKPLDGESAVNLAQRLAVAKSAAGRLSRPNAAVVLGADTVVVVDGMTMGKPDNRDDAVDMLMRLSDRVHEVVTAVAVNAGTVTLTDCSTTEVRFRSISATEAASYWGTGEPADKAGAYAIQGIGGAFVQSIAGSYSGVVGLPVFETASLLNRAGIDVITAATQQVE